MKQATHTKIICFNFCLPQQSVTIAAEGNIYFVIKISQMNLTDGLS